MRKLPILLGAALLCGAPALLAADEKPKAPKAPAPAAPAAPATPAATTPAEAEKLIYELGVAVSQNLAPFNLSPKELEVFKNGVADGVTKKAKPPEMSGLVPRLQVLQSERAKAMADKEKKASEPYLAKMGAEKGAKKMPSGLIYIETKAGSGESPKATDTVKVNYHGTLSDGTVFDSSKQRGQPATFPLNGVIKCWTEGVAMMKVGGSAKLVCPSDIAYGDQGRPSIPPGAVLTFEVDLLEIIKTAQPAAPPAAQPPTKK